MRKFTTQILSLLTALSFAGALSAQTVEDAIGAADNATGGNKLGLTVEGYFMYGLLGGNGEQNFEGLVAEDLADTTKTFNFKFYGASQFGGGLNVGYELAPGLDVVGGFKFASYNAPTVKATATTGLAALLPTYIFDKASYDKITSHAAQVGLAYTYAATLAASNAATAASTAAGLTAAQALGAGLGVMSGGTAVTGATGGDAVALAAWQNAADAGTEALVPLMASGITVTGQAFSGTLDTSFTTMVANLGLRSRTRAWAGEVYAGAGLNIALPTEITQTLVITDADGTTGLGIDGATYVRKFGTSIAGLYGELGYNYDVMPNLYVGGGVRLNFNVPNDVGETAVLTYTANGATVHQTTTTRSESHLNGDENATGSGTAYTNKSRANAFGMTDLQVQLNVG